MKYTFVLQSKSQAVTLVFALFLGKLRFFVKLFKSILTTETLKLSNEKQYVMFLKYVFCDRDF